MGKYSVDTYPRRATPTLYVPYLECPGSYPVTLRSASSTTATLIVKGVYASYFAILDPSNYLYILDKSHVKSLTPLTQ